jgi:hypothetical protein
MSGTSNQLDAQGNVPSTSSSSWGELQGLPPTSPVALVGGAVCDQRSKSLLPTKRKRHRQKASCHPCQRRKQRCDRDDDGEKCVGCKSEFRAVQLLANVAHSSLAHNSIERNEDCSEYTSAFLSSDLLRPFALAWDSVASASIWPYDVASEFAAIKARLDAVSVFNDHVSLLKLTSSSRAR